MQQIQKLCQAFMRRLGPNFKETFVEDYSIALAVAEQAPPGQKLPSGKKIEYRGGATMQQLRYIANTSKNDEEGVQRIYDLIILGKDPAPVPQQMVSVDQVDAIVRQRLAEILDAMKGSKQKAKEVVADVVAEASRVPEPDHQVVTEAKPLPDVHDFEGWTEIARSIGMRKPTPRKNKPDEIDGRWIASAKKRMAPAT